jgi:hypothetical protein
MLHERKQLAVYQQVSESVTVGKDCQQFLELLDICNRKMFQD